MKFNIRYLLVAMLSLFGLAAQAQVPDEIDLPEKADTVRKTVFFNEQQGYLTLGLNGGFSYQSSDVTNNWNGWGLGATLSKNLLHGQGNWLDFDGRGRFLYANSSGLSGTASRGIANNTALNGSSGSGLSYKNDSFYFPNYRNDMVELGAEGVITFNQLRENKGILFQLYGGVGLNWHLVNIDQTNASNAKYNYRSINQNQGISGIRADLKSLLDKSYETTADGLADGGEVTLSSHLGAELGFHVTPKFMIGIGHKLTFTGTDLFDGQQWLDNNTLGAKKDIHHYTSLDLKWIINPKPKQPKRPTIEIITPDRNPHTTARASQSLVADIANVQAGVDQVTVTLNGQKQEFNFYRSQLVSELSLRRGANEVVIRATNSVGNAEARTTIIYSDDVSSNTNTNTPRPADPPPPPSMQRPTVQIVRPQNNATIEYSDVAMRADLRNVSSRNEVSLTVNGRNETNFDYTQDGISSRVALQEGANRINVTARNNNGSSSDEVTVYYRAPQPTVQRPAVRITNAPDARGEANGCSTSFSATVSNVVSSNNIEVSLNGTRITNFSFQNQTIQGNLNLRSGNNRLLISARNEAGESADEADITCTTASRDLPKNPPTVSITEPTVSMVSEPSTVLRATVRNATQDQISVKLNGQPIRFTYFSGNQVLTATVNDLREGNNEMVVSVTNADGSAQDTRSIVYKKTVVELPRPPKVNISQPTNGSTVNEPTVNVRALITNTPDPRGVTMTVNGQSFGAFRLDKSSSNLTARVDNLREGENTITVLATNKDGSDQQSVTVNYARRKLPPTVQIFTPSNNATLNRATVGFSATVKNVSDKNSVSVLVNGNSIGFELAGEQVKTGVTLNIGQNTIQILVRNADGEARDQITVTYREPVQPPVVNIASPANGTQVNDANATILGSISNVKTTSGVGLYRNGQPITGFNFDPNSGQFSANVVLSEGANSFTLQGRNEAGTVNAQTEVIYKKPIVVDPVGDDRTPSDVVGDVAATFIKTFNVARPVLDPMNPNATGAATLTATFTSAGNTAVQLFINGVEISDFQFNREENSVSHSFQVTGGKTYDVILRVTGAGGTVEKNEILRF